MKKTTGPHWLSLCVLSLCSLCVCGSFSSAEPTLELVLTQEGTSALATAARAHGDAGRGAVLFHRPHVGCTKCHAVDGSPSPLGPDLTRLGKDATDEYLVESVLVPSKVIRQGFE